MDWRTLEEEADHQRVPVLWLLRDHFQRAVLYAMAQQGAFSRLAFQGGTALRLCYGNQRFSEDPDFVSRVSPLASSHDPLDWASLADQVHGAFPWLGDLSNRTQKATRDLRRVILASHLPNGAAFRVHCEFVRVPARDVVPQALATIQGSAAIVVESREEILADKVIAMGLRPYIKGRDVWDIAFLRAHGTRLPMVDIPKKLRDYHADVDGFRHQVALRTNALKDPATHGTLRDELSRFVPADQMDALDATNAWADMASASARLLEDVAASPFLSHEGPRP